MQKPEGSLTCFFPSFEPFTGTVQPLAHEPTVHLMRYMPTILLVAMETDNCLEIALYASLCVSNSCGLAVLFRRP